MIIENVIIVVIDSTDRKKGDFSFDFRQGLSNVHIRLPGQMHLIRLWMQFFCKSGPECSFLLQNDPMQFISLLYQVNLTEPALGHQQVLFSWLML